MTSTPAGPAPDMLAAAKAPCGQAGYLPVPLRAVPADSLAGLKIYLANRGAYSLYNALALNFGPRDVERLLESGVEYVYISTNDHQVYYRTMENCLETIIADPSVQRAKKSEILYATSLELANQLLATPPGQKEIARAANMARGTVQMIIQDRQAFSTLFEAFDHDLYTASHMVNVCTLAVSLGQRFGIVDQGTLQNLGTGCLLHDVGKIFVPNAILNKPGRLTDEEFTTIKSHVQRGYDHLRQAADLSEELLSVVVQHHERLDGSGYPNGLAGDRITPLGRLAGIIDVFDALTCVRPYRDKTFTVAEALQMLEDDTPDKYDREMFQMFAVMIESAVQSDADSAEAQLVARKLERPATPADGLEYYFRMPVHLHRVVKTEGRVLTTHAEKVIAHRLSCHRVGFLSYRPYRHGDHVLLRSDSLERAGLQNLLARVKSCQDHANGWFTVDAIFLRPQTPDAIANICRVTNARQAVPAAR